MELLVVLHSYAISEVQDHQAAAEIQQVKQRYIMEDSMDSPAAVEVAEAAAEPAVLLMEYFPDLD